MQAAKDNDNGKPTILIAKTLIGKGIPEVAGTAGAHGEGGAKFAAEAHQNLGLPEETFFVSEETRTYFAEHAAKLAEERTAWEATYEAWSAANPELAEELRNGVGKVVPTDLIDSLPTPFRNSSASSGLAADHAS